MRKLAKPAHWALMEPSNSRKQGAPWLLPNRCLSRTSLILTQFQVGQVVLRLVTAKRQLTQDVDGLSSDEGVLRLKLRDQQVPV